MIFEIKILVGIMIYLTLIYYNFIKYFWPSGHWTSSDVFAELVNLIAIWWRPWQETVCKIAADKLTLKKVLVTQVVAEDLCRPPPHYPLHLQTVVYE